jgi:acyl-CoA reductase-like NAD-dependent aldehyde dehydrogenase
VTLELGGKSANIVFADADLERAAAAAPMAVFGNAGQDCCARSRILVERSVLERFMACSSEHVLALGSAIRSTRHADGTADLERQRDTVASFLDRRRAGRVPRQRARRTRLLVRADRARPGRPERPRRPRGDLRPDRRVIPFADEEEAIRLANDTIYGLSGSIWTRDGARALRVARAIDTGVLSINSNTSVRVATPFGGFKQSGYGRELGPTRSSLHRGQERSTTRRRHDGRQARRARCA